MIVVQIGVQELIQVISQIQYLSVHLVQNLIFQNVEKKRNFCLFKILFEQVNH
jgi:hypothetical protein